jgi:hypothetical protein
LKYLGAARLNTAEIIDYSPQAYQRLLIEEANFIARNSQDI